MAPPRVMTVPAGVDFLSCLVSSLLDGRLIGPIDLERDPLALARVTLFVPNRRTARALVPVFAQMLGTSALLPRILPLGDTDEAETELVLDRTNQSVETGEGSAIPPAIPPLERLLTLAGLVQAWGQALDKAIVPAAQNAALIGTSPREALALGRELAGLLDALAIEGKTVTDLAKVDLSGDQGRLSELSLAFLGIVAEIWPNHLANRGFSDIASRRDALLRARAAMYARIGAKGPVIAAGSTGSMPATATLLAAIARLPMGVVVLPGLDQEIDAAGWAAIGDDDGHGPAYAHPQYMLHRLLERLEIPRADVVPLAEPSPSRGARARILSAAMRPSGTIEHWPDERRALDEAVGIALADMTLIEAPDERSEAQAIAVLLREAASQPGVHAALVTPDRALAERVSATLERWGIEIDDSAGQPLSRARRGLLARLVAQCAQQRFDPSALLALLDHPLACFGMARAQVLRAAKTLELAVLRGHSAPEDMALLRAFAANRRALLEPHRVPQPLRRLSDADWQALDALLEAVERDFSPILSLDPGKVLPLGDVIGLQRVALEAVARDDTGRIDTLYADSDGEALARLLDGFVQAEPGLALRMRDYPALLGEALDQVPVRPPQRTHPRLTILGLIEARLMPADHVILAGLNETVWPPQTRTSPLLDRAVARALGLPMPERRIGQTAHDFVQAATASRVTVTRARRSGNEPSVASRFWQRLEAFCGRETPAWQAALKRGEQVLALVRLADRSGPDLVPVPAMQGATRPAPSAPAMAFPDLVSVTEVETLRRDPYGFYAKRILKLDPLPPIQDGPDLARRGTLIHAILEDYATGPEQRLKALLTYGRDRFAASELPASTLRFWWPLFERMARFFIQWDTARRDGRPILSEKRGEIVLPLADGGALRLSARADRIERGPQGLIFIDYKTGTVPSNEMIATGLAPQLTLEAAIAGQGGFADLPAGLPVEALLYLKLGGREGGTENLFTGKTKQRDEALADVIARHQEGLRALAAAHRAGRPFVSRAIVKEQDEKRDYDHLARLDEWSRSFEGKDGGGSA